jgi:hypothetical protein
MVGTFCGEQDLLRSGITSPPVFSVSGQSHQSPPSGPSGFLGTGVGRAIHGGLLGVSGNATGVVETTMIKYQ